jgi:carbonic anhydrase
LLLAVVFLAPLLNKIPLAALAAILIMVGYKLSNAGLYKQQYKLGYEQFIPFMVTIIGVLLTDLLKGIAVGMGVAIFFILRKNYKNNYTIKRHEYAGNDIVVMELSEELTYLNKASINETLQKLKENTKLVIDGSRCKSIDYDALEIIENFVRYDAIEKKITVELIDIQLASISNIVSPISHSNPEKNMETFYNQLLENNKKWVDRHMERDPEFFQRLSKGQNPPLLWIGCADSRVPANEIIGAQPGEVFVHRNIANMVVHSDMNMLSVLDYAVNVLKVKHVIVCGHYGCGGVQAAMTNKHIGLIDNWIRHIKDTYRFHQQELNAIEDEKQRFDRFVELNVVEQVYDLAKTSIVQSAWENGQDLHIHGWVYDVADGLINDLKITLKNNEQLSEVYQLDL